MIKVADNTERINALAEEAISQIKNNAEEGNPYTELSFPKHLASDVRDKIDTLLGDTKFVWCTMYSSPNQYTGKMQYFTGQTIGDTRYYKIKIL
jgi:hypothetical protein